MARDLNTPVLLKQLRLQAGLTQRELAKRLSVTPAAISLVESGRREPRLRTYHQWIEVCGGTFEVSHGEALPSLLVHSLEADELDALAKLIARWGDLPEIAKRALVAQFVVFGRED